LYKPEEAKSENCCPKERMPGERRVALIPDVVSKLVKSGIDVMVESNAGEQAGSPMHNMKKLEPQLFSIR